MLVGRRRSIPGLAFIGVATTCLLLAHWGAYLVAYQQVHLRDVVLAGTGHSYLGTVVKLASILLFLGFAWMIGEAFRCKAPVKRSHPPFPSVAIRFIAAQTAGFSALEVVERMSVHAPVAEMFQHQTYVVGVVLQVLTALAGALLILLLTRAVERARVSIATHRRRRLREAVLPRPTRDIPTRLHRGLWGNSGVRGPPELSRI